MNQSELFGAAYELALRWIGRRDRMRKELHDRLVAKGFDVDTIQAVIQRLEERRILNDERAIEDELQRATGRRSKGPIALRASLEDQGAGADAIDSKLSSVAPEEWRARALEALQTRFERSADGDRMARFLMRRGFEEELTISVVEEYSRRSLRNSESTLDG